MVEENKEKEGKGNGEKESRTSGVDAIFNNMSEIQPPRDVEDEGDIFGGDEGEAESINERMKMGRKMSDFQIADMRLNPDLSNNGLTPYLQMITMGRTFPDVYNDLLNIFVKDILRSTPLTATQAIASANTALSESIDGEARIDTIVMIKGAGESKTEEEKKKLGLP
jgi:hypothetical protein